MEKEDEFCRLKTSSLEQLARLLYIRPTCLSESDCEVWLSRQQHQQSTLDRPLRKTALRSIAQNLLNFSNAFDPKPEFKLCKVHRALNHNIIGGLMALLVREVTCHTDRYRHRRKDCDLPPLMNNWLTRVDEISALWMGKDKWEQRMKRGLALQMPWTATLRCTACQLAVVGGSQQFLIDLRTSLVARAQYARDVAGREISEPRLLRMVEAWISICYPTSHRIAIRDESRSLADMLFAQRYQMKQTREHRSRYKRRQYRPSATETTDAGLTMPRAVSEAEAARERGRRQHGEFYGERDSGWVWTSIGSTASSGGEYVPSGHYEGGYEQPLEEAQGSQWKGKSRADEYAPGPGEPFANPLPPSHHGYGHPVASEAGFSDPFSNRPELVPNLNRDFDCPVVSEAGISDPFAVSPELLPNLNRGFDYPAASEVGVSRQGSIARNHGYGYPARGEAGPSYQHGTASNHGYGNPPAPNAGLSRQHSVASNHGYGHAPTRATGLSSQHTIRRKPVPTPAGANAASTRNVGRLNLHQPWDESVSLNKHELSPEELVAKLQLESANLSHTGDARLYPVPAQSNAPQPCSPDIAPGSPTFSVSPLSSSSSDDSPILPENAFTQPPASSTYSAYPGQAPANAGVVPPVPNLPSTAPPPLSQRAYRPYTPPTQPSGQSQVAQGTASCYEAMGWGGPAGQSERR